MFLSKKDNISNALILRRNILELLKIIEHSKDIDIDNIERIKDYLSNYGDIIIPIIIDELKKKQSDKILYKYENLLVYLDNYNLIKPLINCLMENKENTKLRKTIIRVLKRYYVSFNEPPLSRFYAELIEEIEKIGIELISSFNENWDKFLGFYTEFLYLQEGQTEILKVIEELKDDKKYDIFLTMLLTNDDQLIRNIIETLGRIDHEKSLLVLKRALVFLPLKYHGLIELNMRKLNFKGIRYQGDPIEENYINNVYLGYPFSNGLRHLLYLLKKGDFYHILFIEIDEVFGITENCMLYANLNEDRKDHIISRLVDQFYLKQVNNNYDLKIINHGIFNNYAMDVILPPVFSIFINYLPAYYFKPILYKIDSIRERLRFRFDENSIKNSDKLWELVDILGWLTEDMRFVDIVEKWYVNSKKEEQFWMDEIFIKKVLREIILSDINIWKERLLMLADFLDNVSEHRDYIGIILAVEQALEKDVEKMERIPFFKKLILESKKMVLMNL